MPSGCDAAYVLASAYGPGLPRFVAKMNALARQLGLGRTHFANADGLPLPREYSTYSTPRNLLRHRPGRHGLPAVPLHRGRAPDLPARRIPGTTPISGTPPTS